MAHRENAYFADHGFGWNFFTSLLGQINYVLTILSISGSFSAVNLTSIKSKNWEKPGKTTIYDLNPRSVMFILKEGRPI